MSRLQPGSLHNTVNPRTDHALLAYANFNLGGSESQY
uniref:Cupin domain-containing protein n=1 Tax=Echinococcus granulosus TaxID=6210 RepID=A0A068WIN1_ECHGR|nr:hypothetical protein EgrG_001030600 [Echinococcus granulosus]